MTDPNTIAADMERKLSSVRTLAELAEYMRGLEIQGYAPDHARRIVATRKAELERDQ